MDNATRRHLLNRHRASGFPGSILDVYNAYSQGVDLIGQFEQQNNIEVARTPEQQQQGLRPAHQAGDINKSMIFPNVPPNTPFTTEGMKAPINIEKYDEQGHLVKSYENVPPGVRNLPTGPQRGTVIETPANMQGGGVRKYQNAGVTISPEEYEAKLDAAINKYGDVGLSFDPVSQEFAPGVQMLDPAEVAADFDLDNASMQARNNYFAYKNLGQQGLQDSMGMFNSINNARNQFAEDYLAPALDAGLFLGTAGASSGASALARGFGTATRVAPKAVGSAIRGINTGKSMLSNTVGNLTTRALNPVASTRFGQAVGQGVDYANKGAKYLMKPGQSVMNWAGNTRVGSAIGNFVNAPQTLLGGQTLGQASSAYTTAAGAYNAPKSFAKLTEGDIGGAASGISKLPVGNQIASALKAPKTLYNMYSGAKGLGEIAQGDILQGTSDFSKVLPGTGLYRNTVTAGNLIGSNSTPTRRTAYMSPKEMQSGSWRDSFVAESTYQPSFAEQAFLNQQNALPTLDAPRYRDEGTIREGNFEVDKDNNIVEDRSYLEMAANPVATARAIIDPSVEGLPSRVELDQAKSKGTGIGQFTNDLFNPAAWVNYGVDAYQDFNDATGYILQGEGQKALQSLSSGTMNALGAIPALGAGRAGLQAVRRAGVTGVGDLYKLNPYLKNPMGFRNVGDKPNFLFGYTKPIDPKRMDLSPEAGFDEFLGQRNSIRQSFNSQLSDNPLKAIREREAAELALYETTPFGKAIGEGGFGSVHPIKGTDSVIKIGKGYNELGLFPPGSRYSGMTDDFLDRASDLSNLDNVAIPFRSRTIPQRNFGQPQTVGDFSFQPVVPRTELTVMKGLDKTSDFGFTGPHAGRNPASIRGLVQPSRDQFAAALRKIRQLRDRGIGIDLDNPANIRFNSRTGDFNLYDLENMPQLAARNARELEQLNIRYGKMVPYPGSPAQAGQLFQDPSHYMQEARTLLGTVAGGIPNKQGLRLIDNFQVGGLIRKYQGAGPKKVFTMGMKDKYDIVPSNNPISDFAANDPAKFVDTAGADFNLQWNNSPMAKKMLTDSYLKSSGNTSFLSRLPYVGSYFFSEPSNRAAETTNKRNQSILNTQFRAASTEEDFKDLYGHGYNPNIGAFASMNQLMPSSSYTAYNPTWSSQGATPYLLGVGVHERSHTSDNAGSFIPPADIRMMYDARSSDEENKVVYPTSDAYRKYIQEPTETRARIMEMRRGLSAKGVDVFNSPVSKEDFYKYIYTPDGEASEYNELRRGYTEEDIFKMLNAIAYEEDDKQPENVAKRGGIRIKERNRGRFTAFAKSKGMSVQEAARHVLANKDRYSTALIRRANFARNAARWNR